MLTNPFFNMFPVTAGNWQTIDTRWWSPTVSVNFAGNPAVEREVTEDVASYGRQIGWLGDIVLALAEAGGEEVIKRKSAAADSLIKLRQAQERIQEIKQRRKNIAAAYPGADRPKPGQLRLRSSRPTSRARPRRRRAENRRGWARR